LPKLDLECKELLAYDSAKTPEFGGMKARRDLLFRVQEDSAGMLLARSFVTTRQLWSEDTTGKPGNWRPIQVGAAYYREKIDVALESVPAASRKSAVVIEAPALEKVFVGYVEQGVEYLSPVRLNANPDTTRVPEAGCLQWPKQGRLPARQAFAKLAKCFSDTVCDKRVYVKP